MNCVKCTNVLFAKKVMKNVCKIACSNKMRKVISIENRNCDVICLNNNKAITFDFSLTILDIQLDNLPNCSKCHRSDSSVVCQDNPPTKILPEIEWNIFKQPLESLKKPISITHLRINGIYKEYSKHTLINVSSGWSNGFASGRCSRCRRRSSTGVSVVRHYDFYVLMSGCLPMEIR